MTDRRKAPRVDVVLKVHYEREQEFQESLLHNLSPGGLYLETETPLDIGSELLVEIHLPERPEPIKSKIT